MTEPAGTSQPLAACPPLPPPPTDRGERLRRRALHAICAALPLTAVIAASAWGASVNVAGTAYVDYWFLSSPAARSASLSPLTPEAALKIEVDVHENLSFSGRLCFGCHGLEVDRAHIDFTPSQYFNIQAGRIGVPFGEFSVRYDPTSHRSVSKPLIYEMGRMPYYGRGGFNLGVVPTPYVDTGVVVYGQLWLGESVQLWYGGYVVGGLKGQNDFDWVSMRTPYYLDNNRWPSAGGRGVLTFSGSGKVFRDFSIGFSGMHGFYDPDATRRYTALGADVSLRLGPLTLRSEAALIRFEIDKEAPGYTYHVIDPFVDKGGFYVEAEHPLGSHLIVLYRFELFRRAGVPMPGSFEAMTPDSRVYRYTQALQIVLGDSVFLKASYEYWWLTDFPAFHAIHTGLGGTF